MKIFMLIFFLTMLGTGMSISIPNLPFIPSIPDLGICNGQWQYTDIINTLVTINWQYIPLTNTFITQFLPTNLAQGFWYAFGLRFSPDKPIAEIVYSLRWPLNDTQLYWSIYSIASNNVSIIDGMSSLIDNFQNWLTSGLLVVRPTLNASDIMAFLSGQQCAYFVYMRGHFSGDQPLPPDEVFFNQSLCIVCSASMTSSTTTMGSNLTETTLPQTTSSFILSNSTSNLTSMATSMSATNNSIATTMPSNSSLMSSAVILDNTTALMTAILTNSTITLNTVNITTSMLSLNGTGIANTSTFTYTTATNIIDITTNKNSSIITMIDSSVPSTHAPTTGNAFGANTSTNNNFSTTATSIDVTSLSSIIISVNTTTSTIINTTNANIALNVSLSTAVASTNISNFTTTFGTTSPSATSNSMNYTSMITTSPTNISISSTVAITNAGTFSTTTSNTSNSTSTVASPNSTIGTTFTSTTSNGVSTIISNSTNGSTTPLTTTTYISTTTAQPDFNISWSGSITSPDWIPDYNNLSSPASTSLANDLRDTFCSLSNRSSSVYFYCTDFQVLSLKQGSIKFNNMATLASNGSKDSLLGALQNMIATLNSSNSGSLKIDPTASVITIAGTSDTTTQAPSTNNSWRIIVGCVVGIGGFFILVAIIAITYMFCKYRHQNDYFSVHEHNKNDGFTNFGDQPTSGRSIPPYFIQSTRF